MLIKTNKFYLKILFDGFCLYIPRDSLRGVKGKNKLKEAGYKFSLLYAFTTSSSRSMNF